MNAKNINKKMTKLNSKDGILDNSLNIANYCNKHNTAAEKLL